MMAIATQATQPPSHALFFPMMRANAPTVP